MILAFEFAVKNQFHTRLGDDLPVPLLPAAGDRRGADPAFHPGRRATAEGSGSARRPTRPVAAAAQAQARPDPATDRLCQAPGRRRCRADRVLPVLATQPGPGRSGQGPVLLQARPQPADRRAGPHLGLGGWRRGRPGQALGAHARPGARSAAGAPAAPQPDRGAGGDHPTGRRHVAGVWRDDGQERPGLQGLPRRGYRHRKGADLLLPADGAYRSGLRHGARHGAGAHLDLVRGDPGRSRRERPLWHFRRARGRRLQSRQE